MSMESLSPKKSRCPLKNPIWKLKYEQDCSRINHKLKKQLSADILRLYENSTFVDIKLEVYKKQIFCHSIIVESRCLPLWSFIIKLRKLQSRHNQSASVLTIYLPLVDFYTLENFVRSLYTETVNYSLWDILKPQFEDCVVSYKPKKPLIIEKLDLAEERKVEELITQKIKKGEVTFQGPLSLNCIFRSPDDINSEGYTHQDKPPKKSRERLTSQNKSSDNVLQRNSVGISNVNIQANSGMSNRGYEDSEESHHVEFCHEKPDCICSFETPPKSLEISNPKNALIEHKQTNSITMQCNEDICKLRNDTLYSQSIPVNPQIDPAKNNIDTHRNTLADTTPGNSLDECNTMAETSSLEVELASSEDIMSVSASHVGSTPGDAVDGLKRTRTFEVLTPVDNISQSKTVSVSRQSSSESREAERIKGSLIFEHNFQTFSNIPSTNMMTLSCSCGPVVVNTNSKTMISNLESQSFEKPPNTSDTAQNIITINSQVPIPAVYSSNPPTVPLIDNTSHVVVKDPSIKDKIDPSRPNFLYISKSNLSYSPEESPSPDSLSSDVNKERSKELYNWEEKEKDDMITEKEIYKNNVCNGKNVDAIPVVTGFLPDKTPEKPSEDSKNQSMFSMFIDLNSLPSPKKSSKKIDLQKSKSQSGVYMFIEADTLSPKLKKKPTRLRGSSHSFSENKESIDNREVDSDAIISKQEKHNEIKTDKCIQNENKIKDMEKFSDISNRNIYNQEPNSNKIKTEKPKNTGFFFIEASPESSPKPSKRRFSSQSRTKAKDSVMSKSAPTDSHLFKAKEQKSKPITPGNSLKMTKSVIDRDEFMSTQVRRNVSLNEKESSKIPRLVPNFKQMLKEAKEPKKSIKNSLAFLDELSSKADEEMESLLKSGPTLSGDVSNISDASTLLNIIERSSDFQENGNDLGEDLLKLFVNEINTDITIQVGERKIRAHKCILISRCVYFAAMLSGNWSESSKNIMKLQGFAPDIVVLALKYIYSGNLTIPHNSKVNELAALADMLCLDGLKELVSLHMKANSCHYFHKPCADCLIGVLDILPIAGAYSLEDLFRRCLHWVSKHFPLVLPTRGFATMPYELQEKCIKQIINDISVTSVIDTAMGCDRVLCVLPSVKWAHGIIDLANQLSNSVNAFISANFSNILLSDRFLSMNTDGSWSIDKMEETLLSCCHHVTFDEAVMCHIRLTNYLEPNDEEILPYSDMFLEMIRKLLEIVERLLILNVNRSNLRGKWPLLSLDTQKRIVEASLIIFPNEKPFAKLKFSNPNRVRGSSLEPVVRARASSMSDHRLNRSVSTANVGKGAPPPKLKSTLDRCQTPPAPLLRQSLQTPLATRTSTLRAQAAVQRSQSARTVNDRYRNATEYNDAYNDLKCSLVKQSSRQTKKSNKDQSIAKRPVHNQSHKRNFSGPQLNYKTLSYESDENTQRSTSRPKSGGSDNSFIPKLSKCQPRSRAMSNATERPNIKRKPEVVQKSPEQIVPVMIRSNTFSKD